MKRLSAVILCLVLLLSCSLSAAEGDGGDTSFGFRFLFMPNGEGTAAITGVYGGLQSYHTNAELKVPKKVVFPGEIDGYTVTELSLYKFHSDSGSESPIIRNDLEEAEELVIPDSVRRIDYACFAHCNGLTSIVIPEGVEEIGDYAFYSCDKLASVTFPSTLRRIGKQAFRRCKLLSDVTLPEGVEEIGEEAFDFELQNEQAEEQPAETEMLDGHFQIRREGSRVILETILDTHDLDTIAIPEGITDMEIGALYGASFKSLRIPASLTGDLQFGKEDGHNVLWEVAEGNPRYSAADGILIDEEKHMVVSGWRDAEKVVVPEGVEIIGEYAFRVCNMTEITLPSTLQEIQAFAFYDTDKLSVVHFPESLEKLHGTAFIYSTAQSPLPAAAVLHLDLEPEKLKDYFSYETKDGLWKYILFTDDTCAIVEYNYPENAKGTLNVPAKLDGHPVVAVLHTCTYCYKYDALKIPEGVRLVAKYGFSGQTIKKVSLPKSVEALDPEAFNHCNDLVLTEEQKARFAGADPNSVPCYYHLRPDGTVQIDKWKKSGEKKIEIPATLDGCPVTAIGAHAFDTGNEAETIVLPEGLKYIGFRAFYTCSKLKNITVPDSLVFIGNEAFQSCKALKAFRFPAALAYLGNDSFKWTPLKEVILPEGLQYLGDRAFLNSEMERPCTKVVLPGSLKHVGAYAFLFQSALKDVTFTEGIESIGVGAFSNSGITKVILPSTVKEVQDGAFAYCKSLQSMDLGCCETVGENAFAFCPKLKTVVFGDHLQTIADGAFLDHGMKEIVLPATVTKIGVSSLYPVKDASPLTVTFSANVPDFAPRTFTAYDMGKNKTVWPTKLTVKLPADAKDIEEALKSTMSELKITEKEWKLVPAE